MANGGFRSLVGRQVGGLAGSSGFVPQLGGFKSLFGRQVFGLSGSTTPPPPPPPPAVSDNYLPPEALQAWREWLARQRAKRERDESAKVETSARLRETIARAFRGATAVGAPLAEEAREAVAPHVEKPELGLVDWDGVLDRLEAVQQIMAAYEAAVAQDEQDAMDAIRWLI